MRCLIFIKIGKDLWKRVDMLVELHDASFQGLNFFDLSLIFQLIVKIVNTDLVFHIDPNGFNIIIMFIKPRQRHLHSLFNFFETVGITVEPQILLLIFRVDV